MKPYHSIRLALPGCWALLLAGSVHAATLGTAFTYQGRLSAGGIPANGLFDLRLTLFDMNTGGTEVGSMLTNANVAVSNGLFTTTLDFGAGVFNGSTYWLEIALRPGGTLAAFSPLIPRQPITGAPYALYAPNAGNAATVANGVYANGSYADPMWITSLAGGKISGNIPGAAANVTGVVAIGNGGTGAASASDARANLDVAARGANSDITSLAGLTTPLSVSQGGTGAGAAAGALANLGAASLNAHQTFSGSNIFTGVSIMTNSNNRLAGSFSGDGGGLTNLNAANLAGTVADARLSGTYSSALTFNNATNSFTGSGTALTGLNADNLASGTVPDARLAANVARLNVHQTFSGSNHFTGVSIMTNSNNRLAGSFSGDGGGLTNLNAASLTGTVADARLSGTYSSTLTFDNAANTFAGSGTALTGLNGDNLASGTVPDARLAANVARLNVHQTFSGSNIFSGVNVVTNGNNSFAGGFSGNGGGLTNLNSGSLTGTVADARLSANMASLDANQSFTGEVKFMPALGAPFMVGNSTKVDGLNADLLDGLDSTNFWKRSGNNGTNPGTDFLGTTDNQALELKVNNARALRLEPTSSSPNVIGGHSANVASSGAVGAVIGGGGSNTAPNRVSDDFGTVGGGYGNQAGDNAGTTTDAAYATVAGGYLNSAGAPRATIGGGAGNTNNAIDATIGGGFQNLVSGADATIGGGEQNVILANANYATIVGGRRNSISNDAHYATVAGGRSNAAWGPYSFAAGRQAKAIHEGSFVWGDATDADVASTTTNQFSIRASNGVRLTTNAGPGKAISMGERYRDNGIVAWGTVAAGGSLAARFGVANVNRSSTGIYDITLNASASDANHLVPVAIAEVESQPTSAMTARLVTINQTGASTFTVYITNGSFTAMDNDFTFIVTGR